ncbi:MAG: aldo/keto reductase [Anaerolineae bacterium]|jgi:aryl-alcohol dehydrogenase-like predicted oxidoreductase
MEYRQLGRTGWQVSEIGFGAWGIGGDWGPVKDKESLAALHEALDQGVNFIDTADVYGDGRSEQLVGQVLRDRPGERIYVATKAGRRLSPHVADGYNRQNLIGFVERSLENLGVETIDLLQLHCPPTEVYYRPAVFGVLDDLVAAGKLRYYGVSVEKVEEALKAIEYANVHSVQIIFNMFRQRPAGLFFREARARGVGILARVPLASGLLAGKMSAKTSFPESDHRNYNRQGEAFDVGETFAGVPFEVGLQAVEALRPLVPAGATMAQMALRWILMFDAVSLTIPGAKHPRQAAENAAASALPPLDEETMAAARDVYDRFIRPHVHQRW